jgi:predicted alpha/beta-fold hydrolase
MQSQSSRPAYPQSAQFRPPPLLRHRHLQSIITQAPWRRRRIFSRAAELLAASREVLLDCGNGVRLQGFISRSVPRERGLVVLLHGWEGSANSSYVLSAGTELLAAGYSVFRLNLRDHGDTKSLNEGLFHSCRIDEVVEAVCRIREMTDTRLFAVVGQSLGGNFALRVAARAKSANLELNRVIAVCPVLRPHSTMRALDDGFWVYRRYFLNRWRRSLAEKAVAFPQIYQFGDLRRFDSLTDTTAFFVEQYTEFDSLDEYLSGYAITGDALAGLAVSSRIVLAIDDPVIPVTDLDDVAKTNALEVMLAQHGGHCGFVEGAFAPTWIDREIVADLSRLG